MQVKPRIYQKAAIVAALKGLRSRFKRALVVLATGLGKTLTVAFIAKEFKPKKVLFLVHNNFILKHAIEEFRLVFGEKAKMEMYNGMSKNGAHKAEFVFATWQTMGTNLDSWKRNHFDLVIVDEAHHSEAQTYKPVTQYFTGAKLGITATPDREDELNIRSIFGDEVIDITFEEAIARGWLPRIEYHVITDESLNDDALQKIVKDIQGAKRRFTMAEVNRRIFINKRDDEIARIINGYGEKSIVFCSSIAHAERMTKSLELASTFHSKKGNGQIDTWEKNQATLNALKNGLVRRVCAVNSFNEGVNVPSVGLIAFCRVTGVLNIFRQQLGRGCRPGKDKLIVLDFVGNLERIQLVLEMMNKISDLHERFTLQEGLAREGYHRERFEVSGKGFEFTFSDKIVDLMKILDHCGREFYQTWQEASEVVKTLEINTWDEYYSRYREDPCLHSTPDTYYSDWPGADTFFGRVRNRNTFYPNWKEAALAVKKLRISTYGEYRLRYQEDGRLPSTPYKYYSDFPGFSVFLGNSRVRGGMYDTWKEASVAAQKLKIKSCTQYRERYKEDSKLPANPAQLYKNFPGFSRFLGKS